MTFRSKSGPIFGGQPLLPQIFCKQICDPAGTNVNTYLFLFVRPKAACYCTAERVRIASTGVTGLTWLARAGRMEMQTED